jgi:hypothetical protein
MRDQERVLAIQEVLAGFIYEQVVNKDGEFHYDGHNLDTSSKCSIDVNKTLLHFICMYMYISTLHFSGESH